MIVELYACKKCQHVELELNGPCPECGGKMQCTDFAPIPKQGIGCSLSYHWALAEKGDTVCGVCGSILRFLE